MDCILGQTKNSNMKRLSVFLVLIMVGLIVSAQPERNLAIEAEVDEQLWKPFKKAWEQRDAKAFVALHTADVMRINPSSGIRAGKVYTDRLMKVYEGKSDAKRTIDFWLEHRYYTGDIGYEVGYYEVISKKPGEDERRFYARFHIVLRKEEGRWKIAQDWDTSNINGVPVTKEDFDKGKPLDLSY